MRDRGQHRLELLTAVASGTVLALVAVNQLTPDPTYNQPLSDVLSPSRFEDPVASRAYRIAQEIPEVLSELPCYCHCGNIGHLNLLDCFDSDHGAG